DPPTAATYTLSLHDALPIFNVSRLVSAYYTGQPDISQQGQRVTFGTSGHRGSSLENSFNETHILAISQAICDYRQSAGISGPLRSEEHTSELQSRENLVCRL